MRRLTALLAGGAMGKHGGMGIRFSMKTKYNPSSLRSKAKAI
jgi:hypothetical protein